MEHREIGKESKKYMGVGLTLFFLTVMTVAAKNLNAGMALAILIALSIAALKGSLVASFFMHLASEKKTVYLILLLTGILLVVLTGLILLGRLSVYQGLRHVP